MYQDRYYHHSTTLSTAPCHDRPPAEYTARSSRDTIIMCSNHYIADNFGSFRLEGHLISHDRFSLLVGKILQKASAGGRS